MNLITNLFTDYKSPLIASQDENKQLTTSIEDYKSRLELCQGELADCKLRLQVSEVKNKQLVTEWEGYQRERDEMKEMKAFIKLSNIEHEEHEKLLKNIKTLRDENKKLNEEVLEMRRVVINRKKAK